MSAARIHWGRIVVGGILIEVALIALTLPIFLFADMQVVLAIIAPTCFVVAFAISWWLLRRVRSRAALHGFLIGIVATVIYLALVFGQFGSLKPVIEMYGPFLFVLGNGLRILGAVAGGVFAQRSLGYVDRIPT